MSISLPTEASKPVTELGKQTILLYGSPKLGKSSFASKAPGSLFLECEPGLNHLEVYKVPTYSWEAFLEACKLVAKGDHNFKTIVIDTVDNVTIERVVRTKPHPTYEAGDRTGRLPELLPLDYEHFVKAFNSPARNSETGTSSAAKSPTPASTLSGKAK